MISTLYNSDEVVFFGLSFADIDRVYFNAYLKRISEESVWDKQKKRYVTIFTYDEDSRQEIIDQLEKIGVSMRELMAHVGFTFIKTSEIGQNSLETAEFEKLKKRLIAQIPSMSLPGM